MEKLVKDEKKDDNIFHNNHDLSIEMEEQEASKFKNDVSSPQPNKIKGKWIAMVCFVWLGASYIVPFYALLFCVDLFKGKKKKKRIVESLFILVFRSKLWILESSILISSSIFCAKHVCYVVAGPFFEKAPKHEDHRFV